MAQHDQVIDNGPGLVVRQDINSAIAALFSTSSGPVEPQVSVPGQLWLDTSIAPNGQLKQRNLTNNGWVAPNISLGSADLWFGTRLNPDRFIWNEQADSGGADIMTLSETGWLNFGLPAVATGFAPNVGLTTKGDASGGDFLALNNKADGSGTDTIKLRNNGNAEFGVAVQAKGVSALFKIVPTSGNGHVYWMDPSGTAARMILYTASAAQGNGILQLGNGATFTFGTNSAIYANGPIYAGGAHYAGNAYFNTDGNIGGGSIWTNWGYWDAFTAISARIEARAQAWAGAVVGNYVADTRMAGETAFNRDGVTGKWQNSGYVFTGVQGTSAGGDATYYARQPQRYIPNRGWEAAFPF